MTPVSTGHRFRFDAVCTNISLEDAEAGGGDHVCGEAPLCEGYYFLPRQGWAGLGGWGVACSTLTWPLPGPRRAAPNQPPASQDFSRVREFFHVTLRQPQAARMLGPNQVKLPSLENKTPHCLHEKDVSIGVYKRRICHTNYWSYYIWVEVYRTSCAWLSKPPSPQAPSTHP